MVRDSMWICEVLPWIAAVFQLKMSTHHYLNVEH
jgi:hypothetical protein